MQGNTDANSDGFGSDLFWLSLGPVVLPLFTYEDAVLGSVDQHVKRHKGHDAGQTETARINLHTNLGSFRCHTNIQMTINISITKTCLSYIQKPFKIPVNTSGFLNKAYVTVCLNKCLSEYIKLCGRILPSNL